MKWAIVTPDYTEKSAGVEVMHTLCHRLNEAGEYAFVTCQRIRDGYKYEMPTMEPDVIVIPDVAPPIDPKTFPNVIKVRYCLYYPGAHGSGPKEYDEDVIFTFMRKFYPEGIEFSINTLDKNLFYKESKALRVFQTVYIGKGKPSEGHDFKKYDFILTRTEPAIKSNLATILRATNAFYSFDNDTKMSEEAQACGATCYTWDYDKAEWKLDDMKPHKDDDISIFIDAVKAVKK